MYLSYDLKGIQRFIFSIPRLNCIIGGSALISEFDEWAQSLVATQDVAAIYTGGGKGIFRCANRLIAERTKTALLEEAHQRGLDIRFGIADKLSDAIHEADELHPYCPADLSGEPCEVSGLWPVGATPMQYRGKLVHPKILQRIQKARHDHLGDGILDDLHRSNLIPEELADYELEFLSNVNPRSLDDWSDGTEQEEAIRGYDALGRRNRWAIVCMDGNDMGRQFDAVAAIPYSKSWTEDDHRFWLERMSTALKQCTREAFLHALGKVLAEWTTERLATDDLEYCVIADDSGQLSSRLVLPFRPLILGGDDVTLLCHSGYAMRFVTEMSKKFSESSREAAERAVADGVKPSLWPATGGQLTISAGVLFAKTSFPLSLAIPYAERLLASAKGKFRHSASPDAPAVAAVDWETITDTLVDTPEARRRRELMFFDTDLQKEICLTQRPHPIHGSSRGKLTGLPMLHDLTARLLQPLPNSIRADLARALTRPYSERVQFLASIAKRHPHLRDSLWESGAQLGEAWQDESNGRRSTAILDALTLLEESRRLRNPIVVES